MKSQIILYFPIAFLLAFIHPSFGQLSNYDSNKLFDVPALQEDFKVLREVLEKAHIGLYRYTDKKTMDIFLDSSFNQLNHPMTEIDFYKIVNRVMTTIRDEHTFALPSSDYWKNEIGQTIYSGSPVPSKAKLFPFFIKIVNNRLFVDNNLSDDSSIPDGTEILSINDRTGLQIIKTLLPTIHTNGFIDSFRYRNLEQFSLQQTYNRFMVHYAIFIGRPDTFNLIIQKPNSSLKQEVKISALTSQKIYNYYWRRYSSINDRKKRNENPLEFKLLDLNTAYFRLSSFHTGIWGKYNLSYSTEYRNNFKYIKDNNIQNLIIDLRGNEGGNLAIGMELLQYLFSGPYRPYDYHECLNYRFPDFKKYLRDSTGMTQFSDSLFIRTTQNTFRSNPQAKSETWSRPMQPSATPYTNKVYVLLNGATGSAASIFATLIRVNRKDAVFIGEESGGDMAGPISGAGMDIFLPNTKIRADIPFIRRVVNLNGFSHTTGRGIIPDYPIVSTQEDLAKKEDTELNFAIRLIKAGKK
ncbi:S41 family peptidase [Spirosoma endbachense]|uniref:Tail specific protease domain-containing protein n=1 Tax=Spirosoma endbachense TaxID=2666025 RepID=A0A6P1W495_9BACT|nr:S41 family peptidase [Spirosoma endbachense]QHV98760.1 hypothetical protein GJR95_28810 [Spirosoma endbachense]